MTGIVKEMAKQNDKEAVFLLGLNYLQGSGGFEKDLDKAEDQLKKAVKLKHQHADFCLDEQAAMGTRQQLARW